MKKKVTLVGGSPWGFRLVGGTDFRTHLAISKTTIGGKADVAGLQPTDVILSINGEDATQMTHSAAKDHVKNSGSSLTLEIQRADATVTKLAHNTPSMTKQAQDNLPPPPPTSLQTTPKQFTPSMPSPSFPLPPPCALVDQPPTNKYVSPNTAQQLRKSSQDLPSPPQDFIQAPTNQDRRSRDSDVPADKEKLVCEHCKTDIKGPYVSALGKNWHPEHFVCSYCDKTLQNCGFMEEKDQRFCQECYETHFAHECKKCRKRIFGNSVSALEAFWHPECFTCTACRKSFGGNGFLVQDGKPYCEEDYNSLYSIKCNGCDNVIGAGQNYVEAAKYSYHSLCFKCVICGVRLENSQFYVSCGKVKCVNHRNV